MQSSFRRGRVFLTESTEQGHHGQWPSHLTEFHRFDARDVNEQDEWPQETDAVETHVNHGDS